MLTDIKMFLLEMPLKTFWKEKCERIKVRFWEKETVGRQREKKLNNWSALNLFPATVFSLFLFWKRKKFVHICKHKNCGPFIIAGKLKAQDIFKDRKSH